MKHFARIRHLSEVLALLLLIFFSAVKANDLAQPVILVATERLADSALAETVLVAAPLADGSHIGFIVSKPTDDTLASLFPEQVAAREVVDSVYFGGPVLPQALFAIAHSPPARKEGFFELMPGVVVVYETEAIDNIIETAPNDARYFLGFIVWQPGGLNKEIRNGVWQVKPADSGTVFAQKPKNLWKALYHERHGIEARVGPVLPLRAARAGPAASSLAG